MNEILLEVEDRTFNLLTDVEEIDWKGKESSDDLTGYYKADLLFFVMKDGAFLAAYKDEFDNETMQYINQWVDPM